MARSASTFVVTQETKDLREALMRHFRMGRRGNAASLCNQTGATLRNIIRALQYLHQTGQIEPVPCSNDAYSIGGARQYRLKQPKESECL